MEAGHHVVRGLYQSRAMEVERVEHAYVEVKVGFIVIVEICVFVVMLQSIFVEPVVLLRNDRAALWVVHEFCAVGNVVEPSRLFLASIGFLLKIVKFFIDDLGVQILVMIDLDLHDSW